MNTVTGASWDDDCPRELFFHKNHGVWNILEPEPQPWQGAKKILAAGVICQTVVSQGSTDPGAKVRIRMFKWAVGMFFFPLFWGSSLQRVWQTEGGADGWWASFLETDFANEGIYRAMQQGGFSATCFWNHIGKTDVWMSSFESPFVWGGFAVQLLSRDGCFNMMYSTSLEDLGWRVQRKPAVNRNRPSYKVHNKFCWFSVERGFFNLPGAEHWLLSTVQMGTVLVFAIIEPPGSSGLYAPWRMGLFQSAPFHMSIWEFLWFCS